MAEKDEGANRGVPCRETLPNGEEIRLFTILCDTTDSNTYRLVLDDSLFSVTKKQGSIKEVLETLIEIVNSATKNKFKCIEE